MTRKKFAADKNELLKQKERSKLWYEVGVNSWKLSEDLYNKYKEMNQLQKDVERLKYYLRKVTEVLGVIVDTYVEISDGLSVPGLGYKVENSLENQRKKL